MIKTSFQETGYKRTRLQYMAIAAAIGFIGAASLIPLWYNIIYPPILSQFVFLYSIIVTYAIIKHRLMDIEIVIKKGVIYSIIIGLFTGIYIGTLFLFGEFIKNLTGGSYALITILTIILMAIGLQPLKDRLQDWIDKVFFRQKYDSKQTLKQLSTTIGNIIELNELLQLTLQTLSSTLQLKNASALIYNNLNKRFETKASIGLAPDLQNLSISTNFALVQALKETKASILLDETLYLLSSQEQNANTKQKNTLLTQEMKKLGSAMAIPLFAKENLIGILNLGEKRSGESFSTEDIDLLAIFSNNLAVAVENARLHTEILATQKQLFQADKLKSLGTIAAGLAHEIKNPLTSIKGFSQLALDRFKEHDEEFFNQFDEIVPRQLDRINQLVERLNQFSKPPELKRSLTQVNKLIDNLLGLFENKCRKQKIEIVKELETLPTLSADPDQLSQVFMNLMLNAIEAMPQGGKLTIKTSLYEKFKVAVEITDTGMGIPEEELPHIFDPFYTTKPEGTGLGLSIVNQIIEEHHASIEVKSIIGEGTAFRLIFRS